MTSTISTFLVDYKRFKRLVEEYYKTFQEYYASNTAEEERERNKSLAQLQTIEHLDRQQKIVLQRRIQSELPKLRNVVQSLNSIENNISDKRFQKFRAEQRNAPNAITTQANGHYSQQDLDRQVQETLQSYTDISGSKFKNALAAVWGFINPNFRMDKYLRIIENRQRVESMVGSMERDSNARSQKLQMDIDRATRNKVVHLKNEIQQSDKNRLAKLDSFDKKLKELLLNGLEEVFCRETIQKNAHANLLDYMVPYIVPTGSEVEQANGFLAGIVYQNVNVADDGTLDRYLSAIVNDDIYLDSHIILPITVNKFLEKGFCVNYYSEYNEGVFSLFRNYAVQMMNLFSETGMSTYMVDCTHMGSQYSSFSTFENTDEANHVNIIRTADEFENVINELSSYVIDSISTFQRGGFDDIEGYNQNSTIKKEIKAVFISNISEVTSVEMLDKLSSIIRNGSRCGVYIFIGVSTDECQISGVTTQSRVNAITSMIDLCDRVSMSSAGELSFGNGLPGFLPPPTINPANEQAIIQNCVDGSGALPPVLLSDHLMSSEQFFTGNCAESIFIPIGIDALGNEYSLDLNKDAAYMLIGGNPSCGKSSLVHTIILQCITRYSPKNLELYVADLKDGSEFDIYAQYGIRSVKVVLDDSETDVATSFLNYIRANIEMRLAKFKELADRSGEIVRNIEQFYEVNNDHQYVSNIPRMLLIIDEFQSLYNFARDTGAITNDLVRLGRTVGIYIIMASQRVQADAAAIANSFGPQTKEYFIYRGMFKLPYSGAREIMAEQCSDTNHENPALRKAQTLKSGQIIINSNMGATEEDTRLIQCYFPDNETIAAVCRQVTQVQGTSKGVILNSEKQAVYEPAGRDIHDVIILGESNRLFHDECNKNNDAFIDNYFIGLNTSECNRLLACGSDSRIFASVFWSVAAKLAADHPNNLSINLLSSTEVFNKLEIEPADQARINFTESADEFISFANEQLQHGHYEFSVIYDPYKIEELFKNDYSSASETVKNFISLLKEENAFSLVLCESILQLKDNCSYFNAEIPCRVISIGNLSDIRSAMTLDAGEKIADSSFNIIRPNVIKAYYYNKLTDKLGRFRLYEAQQIIDNTHFMELSDDVPQQQPTGYSGLVGN
ncbi:MAG: hypothetical protein H0S79_21260 [Anaerolineaceae bacterium]|nr:hypothetical protein [Anaerolineaceae bacterium]